MLPLDLQLNGYAGVDFNIDHLSLDDLKRSCAAVRAHGGGRILATIITDQLDRMTARIRRLADLHAADPLISEVIAGIHVEGPFISPLPGYVGAHPAVHTLPAGVSAAEQLLAAGCGLVRLVTLAPECDSGMATTRWLADRGVVVSGGHSNASLEQLEAAVEAGLSAYTHLGNGCPLLMHRHDNIIQRVLMTPGLRWIMVIPDGVHIPYRVLGDYIRRIGIDRTIAVTDATAAGGMGPGRFTLAGQEVVVGDDGAAWAADRSHFVGSTASMAFIRDALRTAIGLTADEVDRITSVNPSRAIVDPASASYRPALPG
jgi:N-acetylglucosamine-6-phosphate deacetylase